MSEAVENEGLKAPDWCHLAGTACLFGVLALEADQLTKLWVRGTLALGESVPNQGSIRITHAANSGVAFGIPASPLVSVLLPAAAVFACLAICWRFQRLNSTLLNFGIAVLIGGTLGNLIDRVLHGHVTDFIEMVFSGGDVVVIFNIADICVVLGFVILEVVLIGAIVGMIRKKGLSYDPVTPLVATWIAKRRATEK
ncbi:MAG: signal peptidase II [Dehalococcoidia bacterium]|nr:signal peptidase II [Dehalococcoidia bacterium]